MLFKIAVAVCLAAPICALADPVYAWDSGPAVFSSFGSTNQVVMVGFQAEAGKLNVAGLQIFNYWGAPTGHDITFGLWTDPTNDGNPDDAVLVTSVDSMVGTGWQSALFPVITSLQISDWFYVGAYLRDPTVAYFVTGVDGGPPNGNSRQYVFDTNSTVDLSALGANANRVHRWTADSVGGNLLIRGLTTADLATIAVPEPSAVSAIVGSLAIISKARRGRK